MPAHLIQVLESEIGSRSGYLPNNVYKHLRESPSSHNITSITPIEAFSLGTDVVYLSKPPLRIAPDGYYDWKNQADANISPQAHAGMTNLVNTSQMQIRSLAVSGTELHRGKTNDNYRNHVQFSINIAGRAGHTHDMRVQVPRYRFVNEPEAKAEYICCPALISLERRQQTRDPILINDSVVRFKPLMIIDGWRGFHWGVDKTTLKATLFRVTRFRSLV
ncbi:hypothetical protein C8R44DRAFT_730483 [Mycena epipterygia]|nr:hypothetical protein C8R44DRAFT_730483 [Mycena epipterygia]